VVSLRMGSFFQTPNPKTTPTAAQQLGFVA